MIYLSLCAVYSEFRDLQGNSCINHVNAYAALPPCCVERRSEMRCRASNSSHAHAVTQIPTVSRLPAPADLTSERRGFHADPLKWSCCFKMAALNRLLILDLLHSVRHQVNLSTSALNILSYWIWHRGSQLRIKVWAN